MMKPSDGRGFTLIELLTVIAIIGVLASMVVVGMGRMLEKAKIARCENTLNQMRTSLITYFTSNTDTFPPRYGYLTQRYSAGRPDIEQYWLTSYMLPLGKFRAEDYYDEFSEGHDTNWDNTLQLLEFCPVGTRSGPNSYDFEDTLYFFPPNPSLNNEINTQLSEQRPFVYIPVSRSQAKRVGKYYWRMAKEGDVPQTIRAMNADLWDPNAQELSGLRFPPRRYDTFVLISAGPTNDTAGVVPTAALSDGTVPGSNPGGTYHITALRAYFLATRDANDNMRPDFDFRNRKGGGEDAQAETYEAAGFPGVLVEAPAKALYPTTYLRAGLGPLIYVYE